MFLIYRKDIPIAKLEKKDSNWNIEYLPSANMDISPALPRGKIYSSELVPRFVESMLPKGSRLQIMQKGRHLMEGDLDACIRQCLTLENIGDLKILPSLENLLIPGGRGITWEATVPNKLAAPTLDVLTNPAYEKSMSAEMRTKSGATGLGGMWPKAFLSTSEGEYILKRYPDFDISGKVIAGLEAASFKAASNVGLCDKDAAVQLGSILAIKRFDRTADRRHLGVCHLADFSEERDIFAGSYEKLAQKVVSISPESGKDFMKQILFSYVLGDSDHHSENFAMLEGADGQWGISPLYDTLPSSFIVGDKEQLALTVAGKKSRLALKDFEKLGVITGMKKEEISRFLVKCVTTIKKDVEPVMPDDLKSAFREHLGAVVHIAAGKPWKEVANMIQREKQGKGVPLSDYIAAIPDVDI